MPTNLHKLDLPPLELKVPDDFKLEQEYAQPYLNYNRTPTPAYASRLLTAVQPITNKALHVFAGGDKDPLLRSKAKRLTLDAIRTYDPRRATLQTHLMTNLQQLQRMAVKQQQIISVPEQVALDQYHLSQTERELQDRLGRDPSDAEVADELGLSMKRIRYIRQYKPPVAEGQFDTEAGDEDARSAPAVQSAPAHEQYLEFLYTDLDPIDQTILEYSFGMNGAPKLPANVIARRVGLTPAAVSLRAAKIQTRLDELMDTKLF